MEDWKMGLKEVLISFDVPIEIADLRRIVSVPGDDVTLLFREIANIAKSLVGTRYVLVVEETACLNCNRTNRFSGQRVFECRHCKDGFVPPPKFCINPR